MNAPAPHGFAELAVNGLRLLLAPTPARLGRGADNDIVLDDPSVSVQHARLEWVEGKVVLSDLGSSNGTWVNDESISQAVLSDGDTVRFGGVQAVFSQTVESVPESPPRSSRAPKPLPANPSSPPVKRFSLWPRSMVGLILLLSPVLSCLIYQEWVAAVVLGGVVSLLRYGVFKLEPRLKKTGKAGVRFPLWPRPWVVSFLAALVLGFICIVAASVSQWEAFLMFCLLYGLMTGVRYVYFRYLTFPQDPQSHPRQHLAHWKRPAFLGLLLAAVLVFNWGRGQVVDYHLLLNEVRAFRADHAYALQESTSIEAYANLFVNSFISGSEGDLITPIVEGVRHDIRVLGLRNATDWAREVENGVDSALRKAQALVDAAFYVLLAQAGGVVFVLVRERRRAVVRAATQAAAVGLILCAPALVHAQQGIVLDKAWDSPMQGANPDLGILLSPFAKPFPNTAPSPHLKVYDNVNYLMHVQEAMTILGIQNRNVTKVPVSCPGFPQRSLYQRAFKGSFEGHFNTLHLVTDLADQVVCVGLVADSPNRELTHAPSEKPADWHFYNFILTRSKASNRLWIGNRASYLQYTQWREYHPTAYTRVNVAEVEVVRLDSCLIDPGNKSGDYRSAQWKALEASRLYVPRPLMEMILHCIQKARN